MLLPKLIIISVSLIILAYPIPASNVGVLISFPDGTVYGQCIDAPAGINGYDLLQEIPLETIWASTGSFGHQLCMINGVGDLVSGNTCSYSGKYWGFFTFNSKWGYMPVGFDGGDGCWNGNLDSFNGHYCTKDKDLLGFRYGTFGEFPQDFDYDDICEPLALRNVKVYVDGFKESGVDKNGGKIYAQPNSEIKFKIETENDYLFDDKLKLEKIEVAVIIDDFDDKFKEKIKLYNLKPGEKSRDQLEFKIPNSVSEGDYEMVLLLLAESNNGIKQEIEVEYELIIERKPHKIVIADLTLAKKEPCIGDDNWIYLELSNKGKQVENDVLLYIYNDELGLGITDIFDLKPSNEIANVDYKKNLSFKIPKTVKPGQYKIELNVDYRYNLHDKIEIYAKDCSNKGLQDESVELSSGSSDTKVILEKSASNNNIIINQAIPLIHFSDNNNNNFIKNNQNNFLQKNIVPILLGAFLSILIVIISFIIVILHKD